MLFNKNTLKNYQFIYLCAEYSAILFKKVYLDHEKINMSLFSRMNQTGIIKIRFCKMICNFEIVDHLLNSLFSKGCLYAPMRRVSALLPFI